MFGGIAVGGNLLCVAHSDVRGRVILVDLDDRRVVSFWEYGPESGGWADAGGVAMAVDFAIYVADTRNDVVRCFSAFGKEVARLGRQPQRGPGAAERDRGGVLDRPRSVAVYDDTVWITCGERKLLRGVQRFRRDGSALAPLRAFGDPEARFGAPRAVHVDARGVLVADTLHGVVQRFALDGRYVGQFSTAAMHGETSRPVAVVALPDGDVLIADQGDRRGLRRFGIGGEPRPPLPFADALIDPSGLATDERGAVYVLDRDGERVHRLGAELKIDGMVVDLAELPHG